MPGWAVEAGIDYFAGRKIPAWLDSLGLEDVVGEGHTAQFNGGSDWATYWIETVRELAPSLLKSSYVTEKMLEEFYARYQDSHYWTSVTRVFTELRVVHEPVRRECGVIARTDPDH